MNKIIIYPSKIRGSVKIGGSKNASLPILAASLVTSNNTRLINVPNITDVNNMLSIFKKTGCKIEEKNNRVKINSSCNDVFLMFEEVQKFRASYYLMSVFLALFNKVRISFPGGCKIGARPIDFHLEGFKSAGCSVKEDNECIEIVAKKLTPFIYRMPKKSLGATVNLLILASKIDGKSVIENASTEPEIDDLIDFINKGFAKAYRRKNDIIIFGDTRFKNIIKHRIIPDRIEAFTYMCIGVNSKKLKIKNINCNHLSAPIKYFKEANIKYRLFKNKIIVYKSKPKPINVCSNHYPELSTDQMPLLYPLFIRALGKSSFKEEIFASRFNVCEELKKTSANITVDNCMVYINGKKLLKGSSFYPTDLRCAASLLIEGIINGNSTVYNLHYLDRGYEDIYKKLQKIGLKFKIE